MGIKTLGIDYGKAKVGVAISTGFLTEPLEVIRHENVDELLVRLKKIVEEHEVNKVVVGVSEGQSAKDSRKFGKNLEDYLDLPVIFFDETLSTFDVQQKSIEAGIKRKKRKNMEDAYAAALILQNYLDSQ